jgi:hypothetical protein
MKKYGHPNAEGAKVSQRTQKKTFKNYSCLFCDFCVTFVFLLRSAARLQEHAHG